MRATLVLLLLAIVSAVSAAPAPLPNRAAKPLPPELPASCATKWQGQPFRCEFCPDGSYSCASMDGRCVWVGWWSLDRRTGLLTISERYVQPLGLGGETEYRITLDRTLGRGAFEGGGAFEITPDR